MNINPSSAVSQVAGVSRAAAKGGEADKLATDAVAKQSASEKPGGKSVDSSALDAGEQAGDRGGDGRQMLDTFDHHDDEKDSPDEPQSSPPQSSPPQSSQAKSSQPMPDPNGHIDFEA